ARLLRAQGRIRRRPRPLRARPGRTGGARGRRGEEAADGSPWDRRMDRRVVPRAAPRAAARVAGRRHRPSQGGRAFLRRSRRTHGAHPVRALREPLGALPPRRPLRWRWLVNIRAAIPDDLDLLVSLVERLDSELPPWHPDHPADVDRVRVEEMVSSGVALLAEEGG